MQDKIDNFAKALSELLAAAAKQGFRDILEEEEAKQAQQQLPQPAPKQQAARTARDPNKIKVQKRTDVSKLISEPINSAVDDPECTNEYQILWRRFKNAPFEPKTAVRAFRNTLTVKQVEAILQRLHTQDLAQPIPPTPFWILHKC